MRITHLDNNDLHLLNSKHIKDILQPIPQTLAIRQPTGAATVMKAPYMNDTADARNAHK